MESHKIGIPFGFLVIDKPAGLTSHDCVNKLRKIFNMKRVGHGGTLDPEVTGVLPIAFGDATRLLQYLPKDKEYKGVIQLGTNTNTDDISGKVLNSQPWPELEEQSIEKHLNKFRGKIKQTPPQISSVHVNGERAYKIARRGENVELIAKTVEIYKLSLEKWDQKTGTIEVIVNCSTGTYIRALARDLGHEIGCGGCLLKLKRTKALGFDDSIAVELPLYKKNEERNRPKLISPLNALKNIATYQIKTSEELLRWRTGRVIETEINNFKVGLKESKKSKSLSQGDPILIIDTEKQLGGIGILNEDHMIKPKVVFNAY